MVTPKGPKPVKPRPDFPLFPHDAGQWAKKIRGKLHYFGSWSVPAEALAKYLRERDYLQAGRPVPEEREAAITVRELVNQFLTHKFRRVEAGRLSRRMFEDYNRTCRLIVDTLGPHTIVEDLRPADLESLWSAISFRENGQARSLVAVANLIRWARGVFKYAHANKLIPRQVEYGDSFAIPTKAALRGERQRRPRKLFSAEELRTILEAAKTPLKAMILLGANCGLGPTDLARLHTAALDLKRGWLDYPRSKTAADRRAKLWPETVAAVSVAIAERPAPRDPDDAALLFVTRLGNPWVQTKPAKPGSVSRMATTDSVGLEFRKLLKSLNIPNRGFYHLRHVFRTIGDEVRDTPAINLAMGHVDDTMGDNYREAIADERLDNIAAHVRIWLWPPELIQKQAAKKTSRQPSSEQKSGAISKVE